MRVTENAYFGSFGLIKDPHVFVILYHPTLIYYAVRNIRMSSHQSCLQP
jgi:hypothetical protein